MTQANVGEDVELSVMMGGDDCQRYAGVNVIETNQGGAIRAWIETLRADVCTLERVFRPTTVSLDAPLGLRLLTCCLI